MFGAERSVYVIFFIIFTYGFRLNTTENQMGNSLHNKIYLGRSTGFASRRFQGILAVGAIVGAGLVWIALRTLR